MKYQRNRRTAVRGQWVLPALAGILVFTLILPLNANAQADPATPCCGITAINARSGVVTGKVTATGRTFQFKLNDARQLRALKVGQAVAADFTSGKVTVRPAGAEPVNGTMSANAQADPLEPCCAITAINARSGVVTGKVTATGRTFQFKLNDATQLRALKVGQAVAADFTTAKVTVRVAGAEPVGATLLQ